MNEARNVLESIVDEFSVEKFNLFFRRKTTNYTETMDDYSYYNDEDFSEGLKLGEINFSNKDSITIFSFQVNRQLTDRSGKRAQYEKAKKILKGKFISAGIFIYYDRFGNFRFSLIYPESIGTRRIWSNFRRFTYFVSSDFTNKTFYKQIGDVEFKDLSKIKSAFSITAVTDMFYREFFEIYQKIVENTRQVNDIETTEKARDFILLFAIRTIFLGFIQKKKWLGNNERFMLDFFQDYKERLFGRDEFYFRWLTPLFFEALNSPQYTKVAYRNNDFSPDMESILQKAPYLNGGLFREKHGFDDNDWIIKDSDIKEFFEFLFSHSFTIEENSLEDEDLQLNPEFLGIIFERLVNKANGAVYTPRTEVDLMCRLSLVKWLQKNLESKIRVENLYELFFKESEDIEDLKEGSFSKKEAQEILDKLQNVAICDPAVGSGAFLVGMMQVLDEVEQSLRKRYELNGKTLFDRKKEIIKYSLYGVEVKEWAVWVCQLRLWLSLFVDAPDDLKDSTEPILPNLDFKVREGDSLVQRVASKTFPVSGQIMFLTKTIKDNITKLKNLKRDYYDNKSPHQEHDLKVRELNIYEEIIEEEIKALKGSLKRLLSENDHDSEATLFEEETEYIDQKNDFYEQKANTIREQIADLEEQKQALHSGGKPLVWGIEFAEIFAEKQGFDIVIGNPPYVRKELIEDPTGQISDKSDYKRYLQEMVRIDFPKHFGSNRKINAQSDLYTYFYIRSLRLLNPHGIHTFICSNSWLDVAYGAWLQEFLLERCPVDIIIDNHAKRSFESADINTIISIIHAPIADYRTNVPDDHLIKFVAFKVPFEKAIFTENMLQIEYAQEIVSNELFRVYPILNKELKDAGTEQEDEEQLKASKTKYIGDKWGGKYLRIPDFLFRLLRYSSDYFYKLGDKSKIIGYVHDNNTGINFPKVLFIKSIKNSRKIEILKKDEGIVEYGVKNTGNSLLTANILVPRTFGQDHIILYNPDHIVGKEFYRVVMEDSLDVVSTVLFLNSTFFIVERELFGLTNLGGGGLKFSGNDVRSFLIPKELKTLQNQDFSNFLRRPIKPIFNECGIDPNSDVPIEEQEPNPLPDRAGLDKIVFDALDLTEEERKDVYRAVCRLVWNRISKANSV